MDVQARCEADYSFGDGVDELSTKLSNRKRSAGEATGKGFAFLMYQNTGCTPHLPDTLLNAY